MDEMDCKKANDLLTENWNTHTTIIAKEGKTSTL